jgi:hypothetical protein
VNYSGLRVTRFVLRVTRFGGTGILDNRGGFGPPVSYVAANDTDIHRATRSSQPVTLHGDQGQIANDRQSLTLKFNCIKDVSLINWLQ